MNNVQLGYHRDRQILRELEEHKILNTYQIASLIFTGKNPLRKAQQRLKKLVDKKKVRRIRLGLDEPFAYYLYNTTGYFEHLLAVNWVYVWVKRKMASWEKLWCWEYEQSYKILRPDAFFGIQNTVTNEIKFYFLELDRSHNVWDKTVKYNDLYESDHYLNSYWVGYTDTFPTILCVTESPSRLNLIKKSIARENRNGLNFQVMLLKNLIDEVIDWKNFQ